MLRSIFNKSNRIFFTRTAKDVVTFPSCNAKVQTNLPVYVSQNFFWSTASKTPDDGLTTVYVGQQTDKVYRVKTFSVCSSIMGICAQPALMHKMESIGQLILANAFIGFFTFVTPVLLHILTKKYVTRVDYDPKNDMYTATLITFFLRQRKVTFGPGEAEVPDIPLMFTTFKIKGVPMMVDVTDFDVHHYARILGYDKPLEYKLSSNSDSNTDVTPVNVDKSNKKLE